MPKSPRVGIACPRPGERAAVSDWLRAAGFEPVVLVDACFVSTDLSGRPPVLVVADASLLTPALIASLRKGDPHRPILAIGDAGDPNEATLTRRHVAFHVRPLDESALILAVSLAHAENRLVRRSERREVPRVPMSIEGASAVLLDVSNEGLRLEMDATGGAKLLPQFVVQVPLIKMAVPVQRIWVRSATSGASRKVECGGSLLTSDERTLRIWQRLADPGTRIAAAPAAAPRVTAEGLFGRVTTMFGQAPLALPWRGRS